MVLEPSFIEEHKLTRVVLTISNCKHKERSKDFPFPGPSGDLIMT